MMNAHVSCFFVAAAALLCSVSADCVPQPVLLPVKNVTVNQGVITRGIQFKVGTPPQNFSFWPQPQLNNTYVYDSSLACSGKGSTYCATSHGGWYDAQSSTSRKDSSANGLTFDQNDFGGFPFNTSAATWMAENLTFSSNSSLNGLPIGLPRAPIGNPNHTPMAAVGISHGSEILNSLTNANLIASRVWSFFYGLTGANSDTQMDGHFIMGGYDAQRVQGPGYNFSMGQQPTDCPYPVTIEDMTLDFPNGTSTSIFGESKSAALSACVDPGAPLFMSMPYSGYFENFLKYSGMTCNGRSVGLNWYGVTCDSAGLYKGDFSIKIKGGPKVTLTNDQLLIPDMTLGDDGKLAANASSHELVVCPLEDVNANDALGLGRQFLAAAYMMANLDRNQFTLWQARPNIGVAPQLVAVDKSGSAVNTFCDGTVANITANANTTSPNPHADPSPSSSAGAGTNPVSGNAMSGGTIAGIVIGVTAGLALFAALLFWLLRKHRPGFKKLDGARAEKAHATVKHGFIEKGPSEGANTWAAELPEKAPPRAEMSDDQVIPAAAEPPVYRHVREPSIDNAAPIPSEPQELP